MKCDEARLLLDLHLDGELSQEVADALERHLIRCPQCAGELRSLEVTRSLLRDAVDRADSSPAFRERTAARLHDRLAAHLRPPEGADGGRQWALPFPDHDV
jgi:anti-sigma factor RsiW